MSGHADTHSRFGARHGALLAIGLGLVVATAIGYLVVTRATVPGTSSAEESDAVQAALRLGKPTIVEFGANACASCREMKPILEALQREHGERISVLNIDILKTRGYVARYRIQLMPTQVFFDAQGREVGRNMGKITGPEILAQLGVPSAERVP
jgi:thioredoxin 1